MTRTTKLKIVGPLCLIGGLVMLVVGFQEIAVKKRLSREGITVPATVVGQETLSGRRGSKTYKIIAEYATKEEGQRYQQTFTTPKAAYEAAERGESIRVRYLASDPTVAEIEGAGVGGVETAGTGGIMALIGSGLSYFVYRKRAKPVATPA